MHQNHDETPGGDDRDGPNATGTAASDGHTPPVGTLVQDLGELGEPERRPRDTADQLAELGRTSALMNKVLSNRLAGMRFPVLANPAFTSFGKSLSIWVAEQARASRLVADMARRVVYTPPVLPRPVRIVPPVTLAAWVSPVQPMLTKLAQSAAAMNRANTVNVSGLLAAQRSWTSSSAALARAAAGTNGWPWGNAGGLFAKQYAWTTRFSATWAAPGWLASKQLFPKFDFYRDMGDMLRGIRERLARIDEFAWGLYFAALDARETILKDPQSRSRPLVRAFARTWLRIRDVSDYVLDAVIDVLLSDDWHELDMTDDELFRHLRTLTKDQHEVHRPLFDRQVNYRKIGSLSAEVSTPTGLLTWEQAVTGHHDTETTALALSWEDPRIGPLLNKLPPSGRAVVEKLVSYPDLTWEEAAAVAGVPPEQAEATRRKAQYLAKEQNRRASARQHHRESTNARWPR
jgi:hypothetical protein